MSELRIGVVGYSDTDFDEEQANQYIRDGLDEISTSHTGTPQLVSGLTDIGIPKLAYREAASRGWETVGVACAKAEEYDTYLVDESEEFLSQIDVLLRVGGGGQAVEETGHAKKRGIPVYEYDLPSLD